MLPLESDENFGADPPMGSEITCIQVLEKTEQGTGGIKLLRMGSPGTIWILMIALGLSCQLDLNS